MEGVSDTIDFVEWTVDGMPVKTSTIHTPYDYDSIMHYPANAFSNNGKNTIDVSKAPPGIVVGQRNHLSVGDIATVIAIYGAPVTNEWSVRTFHPHGTRGGYATKAGRWVTGDINNDGKTDLVHIVGGNYVHPWVSNRNGIFR